MKRIKLSKFSYGTMKEHMEEIKSFVGIRETSEAEMIFINRGEISLKQIEELENLMGYALRRLSERINVSNYNQTQDFCGVMARISMVLCDLTNIISESEEV